MVKNLDESIKLGFEVNSVDETMGIVKEKGIDILSGPFQPNPHTKFFYSSIRSKWSENSIC